MKSRREWYRHLKAATADVIKNVNKHLFDYLREAAQAAEIHHADGFLKFIRDDYEEKKCHRNTTLNAIHERVATELMLHENFSTQLVSKFPSDSEGIEDIRWLAMHAAAYHEWEATRQLARQSTATTSIVRPSQPQDSRDDIDDLASVFTDSSLAP